MFIPIFIIFFISRSSYANNIFETLCHDIKEEVVINLGDNSNISKILHQHKLLTFFSPFDWCVSSFDAVCKAISSNFENFAQHFYVVHQDPYYLLFDAEYHINFPYEFNTFLVSGHIPKHSYEQINQKYAARIANFRQALNTKKKVYFVRTGLTKKQALVLRDLITAQYPTLSYTLIAINDANDFSSPWHEKNIRNVSLNITSVLSTQCDNTVKNKRLDQSKKPSIGILVRGESFRIGEQNSRLSGGPLSEKLQNQAAISLYEQIIFPLQNMGYETHLILDTFPRDHYKSMLSALYPDGKLFLRACNEKQVVNLCNAVKNSTESYPEINYWLIVRFDMCFHYAFQSILKSIVTEKNRILLPWRMPAGLFKESFAAVCDTFYWLPKNQTNHFLEGFNIVVHNDDVHKLLDSLIPLVGEAGVGLVLENEIYHSNPAKLRNPYYSFVQRTDSHLVTS